ncbi:MAG: single-stranded DNA-binding protein [Peptostreptococcaceae bacterium]|nr:single-stranded DNA-binding protein [Peptostreptococcaceae bacterium]
MNIAILIGRLTKDPELRYIPSSGNPVANFSIAVDRTFVGKDGQKQADFFNIVVWGKQAENVANYLAKGSQVAVRGRIENRSYETQNGEKRYITEIIADNVQFLGKPSGTSAPRNDFSQGSSSEDTFMPSGYEGNVNAFSPKGLDEDGYKALEDDDVPF